MGSKITAPVLIAVSLLSWAATASAATGTYKGESKAAHGKLCHYDVQGSDRTVNIPSTAMCSRLHEFPATPPNGSTSTPPEAVSDAGAMKASGGHGVHAWLSGRWQTL